MPYASPVKSADTRVMPKPGLGWGKHPRRAARQVLGSPGRRRGGWPMMVEAQLSGLSALTLQLHAGSRRWPAGTLQPRALELLAGMVAFDGALWGNDSLAAPQLHRVWLQGLAAGREARYSQFDYPVDPLRAAASAAAGRALSLSATPPWPGLTERQGEFLVGYGVASALCIAQVDGQCGQRVFLSLWRDASQPPFSLAEQGMLQFLMPHLVECAAQHQRAAGPMAVAPGTDRRFDQHHNPDHSPYRSDRPQTLPGFGAVRGGGSFDRLQLALCDTQGVLHQVDGPCLALLRQEWPDWSSGPLPRVLVQALARPHCPPYVGSRIVITPSPCDQLIRLVVRRRVAVDRLSERQRHIAGLYADGRTGPQIALALGLTASTVNNHLGVVFKKLAVNNKAQLVRLMSG